MPAAAALGAFALAAEVASETAWLRPGAERSPFSWVAAIATLVAAVCAAALARRGRAVPRLLLAASLTVIAIDEAVGLHERFAGDLDARRIALNWTSAAFAADTVVLVGAGLLLAVEARARPREPLLVAGVALLAGALAMRFGGGLLAVLHRLPSHGARHDGEAAAHAFALTGWLLVAGVLVSRLRGRAG